MSINTDDVDLPHKQLEEILRQRARQLMFQRASNPVIRAAQRRAFRLALVALALFAEERLRNGT